MLKRIHVNQHIIKSNVRNGRSDPPISVKTYRENLRAHHVTIDGPSEVIYRPDRPLACGARLWVETQAALQIEIHGKCRRLG